MSNKTNQTVPETNELQGLIEGTAATIAFYRLSLAKYNVPDSLANDLAIQFGEYWLSEHLFGVRLPALFGSQEPKGGS